MTTRRYTRRVPRLALAIAVTTLAGCSGEPGVTPDATPDATPLDCSEAWRAVQEACPYVMEEPGRQRFCGTVQPLGDSEPVADAEVRVYDADQFFADPDGAVPLGAASTFDACGGFATDVLALGDATRIALVADDAPGAGDYLRATINIAVWAPSQTPYTYGALALRRSTDEAWSAQAGLAGTTFADRGVLYLMIRRFYPNDAVCGLEGAVALRDGAQVPDGDFFPFAVDVVEYHCDDDDSTGPSIYKNPRIEPDRAVTDLVGTALLLGSPAWPQLEHSAVVPGENPCGVWSSTPAGAPPGHVLTVNVYSDCTL
jgi:hypothetical protein